MSKVDKLMDMVEDIEYAALGAMQGRFSADEVWEMKAEFRTAIEAALKPGEPVAADRELLELAAKAAGYTLGRGITEKGGWWHESPDVARLWNPLTDDGDALRLAVKLNIEFACFDEEQQTNAGVWSPDSKPFDCMTPYNGDKQAATRRAIVRAAAEIGRAMK